jgi:uncharacterized membrane protein
MARRMSITRMPYGGATELQRARAGVGGGLGRVFLLLILAAIYIAFGILHLLRPASLMPIMPPMIPYAYEVILFTGACEIAGGIGLLLARTRRVAAFMLAIYAVCVWPANIYHAVSGVHVGGLPDSWWYHGPRLAFQLVFIWWPLFAAGVIDWPLGRRR